MKTINDNSSTRDIILNCIVLYFEITNHSNLNLMAIERLGWSNVFDCVPKIIGRVCFDICHLLMSPVSQYFILKHWSQKRTQNGNIHTTKLDVYAVKQSESNLFFIFIPTQARYNILCSRFFPPHNSTELV